MNRVVTVTIFWRFTAKYFILFENGFNCRISVAIVVPIPERFNWSSRLRFWTALNDSNYFAFVVSK